MGVVWLSSFTNIKLVFPVVIGEVLLTAGSVAINSYTHCSIVNSSFLCVSA
jgi:hypothetical protein